MELWDPLEQGLPLPFEDMWYPLGFPLRLRTNSAAARRAARESFACFSPLFEAAPLEVRVAVCDREGPPAPDPVWRAQGHLLAIVADAANFAVCDQRAGFAFCRLTTDTVARSAWMSWHFLEGITYQLLTQRRLTPVHAACVARNGTGALLCGEAGAGKSTLAFACARAGWTYVSDNDAYLPHGQAEPQAVGKPHLIRMRASAGELFPELREYPAALQPNGKMNIVLSTASLPGFHTAPRVRVCRVVALDRGAGGHGLTRLEPREIYARLCDSLPLSAPRVRAAQLRALRALSAAGGFALRYDDWREALPLLESLAP